MKALYRDYLAILKSFIYDEAPELSGEAAPGKLYNLANVNSMAGILCYTFMRYPGLTDERLRGFFRGQCLTTVATYVDRAEKMKELIVKLDEAGIDHLVFKGFVLRDYYPMPELRAFGDIDFAIRAEDRRSCDELMRSLEYEVKTDWEPVYAYVKEKEYYEVQTNVMAVNVSDKSDTADYFSRFWENAVPCGSFSGHTYVFRPEYHFLYLLAHIAKHISGSGAGIRMYLDLAFFIRHFGKSLDWKWVGGELEKLALADFANTVLNALKVWFGVESPLALRPLDEGILEDFLEFTLEGGTFGFNGRDRSVVYLKEQDPGEESVSRVRTILWHAFPPIGELNDRYTYLQKCPWLLPAAWAHRLIDSRKEWGRYVDNTKKIISADPEEVLKLKRIYKEIGL